ncbi:MAG: hypothetical protein ABSF15_18305 [Candidatus Sulfotelmatobacter sp.]
MQIAQTTPALCRLENEYVSQVLKRMLAGRNEFASGGLLLMIIGGVSVWLRAVPETSWYWIVGQNIKEFAGGEDGGYFELPKSEVRFLPWPWVM